MKPVRTVRTLRAGDAGTINLLARYGDALVVVRYRRDEDGGRSRTVELVIDAEDRIANVAADRAVLADVLDLRTLRTLLAEAVAWIDAEEFFASPATEPDFLRRARAALGDAS